MIGTTQNAIELWRWCLQNDELNSGVAIVVAVLWRSRAPTITLFIVCCYRRTSSPPGNCELLFSPMISVPCGKNILSYDLERIFDEPCCPIRSCQFWIQNTIPCFMTGSCLLIRSLKNLSTWLLKKLGFPGMQHLWYASKFLFFLLLKFLDVHEVIPMRLPMTPYVTFLIEM